MKHMELRRGVKLQNGKYKIRETIGQGGFGYTYLAEHCLVKQKVAIKELFVYDKCSRALSSDVHWPIDPLGILYSMGIKASFLREVKTLWKLRQSHIVHVMDAFEENNTIYCVMEYLNGRTLKQILEDEGALSEDRAVAYIKQVAKGLRYLHRRHRYHLDIKPGNVIVDSRGYAYIIDFGACIHLGTDGESTSRPQYQFTPHFAPYEIETLDQPCAASDVYSLGATLYTLLTNKIPTDAVLRMEGIKHLEPLPNTISQELREIVEKAMRKRARNRYQTMDTFLSKLESLNKKKQH